MLLEDAAVDAEVESLEEPVLVLEEAEERTLVSLRTAAAAPDGARLVGLCL